MGVLAGATIGSVYYALPPECTSYDYYYNCGDVWYQPAFAGTDVTYVVVDKPKE